MRKALTLAVMAMLVLGLSACSTDTGDSGESSSMDMTPSVTQEQLQNEVDFDSAQFVTAEDGEVVVANKDADENGSSASSATSSETSSSSVRSTLSPDQIWDKSGSDSFDDFTLPEAVQMDDGSLGTLAIPKIGLTVSVYETDDEMEAMVNGVAHFKETSCWDGNVGLAGHNQGVNTYFGQIHTLAAGDKITLTTALGTRTYEVTDSVEIDETDWSYLERTDDNRITLITCVNHDLTKRLCVQAVEVV